MFSNRILFLAAVLLTTVAVETPAAELYGTTGQGGALSTLYRVNPATGAVSLVGPVGFAVNGMDYYNGTLYGTTSFLDPNFHGLIRIDPTTGAGTPIGSGWGGSISALTLVELAIDSSGNAFSWGEPGEDDLYRVNLATGTGSRVGESGLGTSVLGLAFDLADNLYLINGGGNTYAIDTTTGAATFLGFLDTLFAHHGDVDPDTGIYYGLSSPFDTFSDLLAVDLNNLTVLSTVRADQKLITLAFIPDQEEVPEPGSLALLVIGGLGVGAAGLRRRLGSART